MLHAQPTTIMKKTAYPLFAGLVIALTVFGQARGADEVKKADGGAVVLAKKQIARPTGTIVTEESTMSMKDAVMKIKAGEQDIEGKMTQTGTQKKTRETLGADKIRQLLVSGTTEMTTEINGEKQTPPAKSEPLEGVPVILERKDGKWTATLESGDKPSTEQQTALDKEAAEIGRNSDFQMYGDTPRKPGDKWDVDPSKLGGFADLEKLTGTFQMEFVEIKDYQGVRCAALKGTFDLKGKAQGNDDSQALDMRLKGEAALLRAIDDMLDMDMKTDATVTVTGSPGPNVTMHVSGKMKMTGKATLKKP